jgi:hypothetical protein
MEFTSESSILMSRLCFIQRTANSELALYLGLDASNIIPHFFSSYSCLFLLDSRLFFFFRIPNPIRLARISSELRLSDGASILT